MAEQRSRGFAGRPGHLVAMGAALMAAGQGRKALALVRQALAAAPDDPVLREAAGIVLAHRVPAFHLEMLADEPRNAAFRRAIERHAPGKVVLDIGAGSGLLAMVAARAGAERVYACEAHEALAETAREIVAANGLGEVVTVVASHSTKLIADDIGGGADLIVAEIFSHHLLGEGALPSLRHAMRELARPGARLLPAGAAMKVALAEYRGRRKRPVEQVEGFDLSLFNRHVSLASEVASHDRKLELRSAAADLFTFDFQSGDALAEDRARLDLVSAGGRVDGAVQWIRLRLDEGEDYENPPGVRSHWPLLFHPFPEPVDTAPGDVLAIEAWHEEHQVRLWTAAAAPSP